MKCQRQRLGWLEAVFLEIAEIQTVSQKGNATKIQRERKMIAALMYAGIPLPVEMGEYKAYQYHFVRE